MNNPEINLPGNSLREKEAYPPKVEKVITGNATTRKRPLGKRVAETFTGDDIKSVGEHVLFSILIPAAKDMLFEAFTGGFERALFGDQNRGVLRAAANRMRGTASYDKMYVGSDKKKEVSARSRANFDFDEIVIDSRGEAEVIIEKLVNLISEFDAATVSDLYDAAGLSHSYTDRKWGWKDLRTASVNRIAGGGYVLNLPRPVVLD